MAKTDSCPACGMDWTAHAGIAVTCAVSQKAMAELAQANTENAELRRQLRDRNHLLLAAKLAWLPDDAEDFSDDAFAVEIMKKFKTKT